MRAVFKSKESLLIFLSVLCTFFLLGFLSAFTGIYRTIEYPLYDLQFIMRKNLKPNPHVVIVSVDDYSRKELKKNISQWPRKYYALAVQKLSDMGAGLIVFDIDFSQPSIYGSEDDTYFAQVINEAGNVILPVFFSAKGPTKPLKILEDAALDTGVINLPPDHDGKIRRLQLLYGVLQEDMRTIISIPSLSFMVASYYLFPDGKGVEEFKDSIPLSTGSYNINFPGPPGTFPFIHFSDVLKGRVEPATVRDKIVLIGNTSVFFNDYYPVPYSIMWGSLRSKKIYAKVKGRMPGVEIHAGAVHTLLNRAFIKELGAPELKAPIIFYSLIMAVLFIGFSLSTWITLPVLFALFAGVFFFDHYLFVSRGIYFHQVPFHLLSVFAFSGGMIFHRAMERKEKQFITSTFGRYVSPQVVREIIKNPEIVKLGGEKKELTILFTDLANFTSISESVDPQVLTSFMNDYLTDMTACVFQHGGLVDKYIGDAVMAIFGAPVERSTHPSDAVEAALEMKARIPEINKRWSGKFPEISMRIGINTGEVSLGNFGSQMRFDYTVLGDPVNLASRLEGYNKVFGTSIMISQYTAERLNSRFVLREIDMVRVKGKKLPVRVYEVMGFKTDENLRPFLKLKVTFEKALKLYRSRNFHEAAQMFEEIFKTTGDPASRRYIERCKFYIENPPGSDWDGVHEAKTK